MIICLDAAYGDGFAAGCAIAFRAIDSDAYQAVYTDYTRGTFPYIPGRFYLRELPVLIRVLKQVTERPGLLVVDGYVRLPGKRPGLGMHLFQTLGGNIPVIGIAKNPYRGHSFCNKVLRGNSRRPLYVTSAGVKEAEAADMVRQMSGSFRLPDMVRAADRFARRCIAEMQREVRHG